MGTNPWKTKKRHIWIFSLTSACYAGGSLHRSCWRVFQTDAANLRCRNNRENEFPLKVKGAVHSKMNIKLLQHSPFSYWSRYWICFIAEEHFKKQLIRVSRSPKIPQWCENTLFTPLFSCSAHSVRAPPVWSASKQFLKNQFGISGLPETRITSDELYGAILYCTHCPAVFYCDYDTSPDFMLAWWVNNGWFIIFGYTVSLKAQLGVSFFHQSRHKLF